MITIAEALAIALTLTAVITFAFKAAGPAHSASRAEAPAPRSAPAPTATTSPATTLPPTPGAPSVDELVAQWWTSTAGPKSAALTGDLETMQSDGGDATLLGGHCPTLTNDVATAGAVAPAPSPTLQREWQLTLSTSRRVATACTALKYTQVNTDLQPALYTIRDLTHQVGPYLPRQAP